MQRFMRQKRHLGHISTHFWHGSRPVVIDSSPIHKKMIFVIFYFFRISKIRIAGESSSRRIEIYPRSDWRRTGAGATAQHLEDHHYLVQLYTHGTRHGRENSSPWKYRYTFFVYLGPVLYLSRPGTSQSVAKLNKL